MPPTRFIGRPSGLTGTGVTVPRVVTSGSGKNSSKGQKSSTAQHGHGHRGSFMIDSSGMVVLGSRKNGGNGEEEQALQKWNDCYVYAACAGNNANTCCFCASWCPCLVAIRHQFAESYVYCAIVCCVLCGGCCVLWVGVLRGNRLKRCHRGNLCAPSWCGIEDAAAGIQRRQSGGHFAS